MHNPLDIAKSLVLGNSVFWGKLVLRETIGSTCGILLSELVGLITIGVASSGGLVEGGLRLTGEFEPFKGLLKFPGNGTCCW